MNFKRMARTLVLSTFAATAGLAMQGAQATNINFTEVTAPQGHKFNSLAIDPTTGYFYQYGSYGSGGSETLNIYDSAAAFSANTPSGSVTLPFGFYGTYIVANNGTLYGGVNGATVGAASWSLSTGQQTASIGYAGMSYADFDWGGGTVVNFMGDSTGIYALGGSANSSFWTLEHLGTGLSAQSSVSFSPAGGTLGYGFVINGTLFTGASYTSNTVNEAINASTGAVTPVSYQLSGLSPYYYLSDFTYDPATNNLYAWNTETDSLYVAADASSQFGVAASTASAVPGPAVVTLLVLSLAGLTFKRKRPLTLV